MSVLLAACDLTQRCAMQPIKDMVLGYLEMGPVAWLVLFVVLWVLSRIASFVALLIAGPKERNSK